jgi:hypothetical protein
MKVTIICEVEDMTTPEQMAEAGITDTFIKKLYSTSFEQLLATVATEGVTATRVTSVEVVDNTKE